MVLNIDDFDDSEKFYTINILNTDFVDGEIPYYHFMPPIIYFNIHTETERYYGNEMIEIYYDNDLIQTYILSEFKGYGAIITFDGLKDILWTGDDGSLEIWVYGGNGSNDDYMINYKTIQITQTTGSLLDSVQYLGKRLAYYLTMKGVNSDYSEGLISLINKVELTTGYSPPLDGTDNVNFISNGYEFTTGDGYGGGYHQCGYLSDGFLNTGDWELTMTLQTSKWDGGFAMFTHPYTGEELSECGERDKWNCIFNNGESDMIEFIDGNIKMNKPSGLSSVGNYTRNSTQFVKFVKNNNQMKYYENDTLKSTFTWDKLATAKRIYLGCLTWGNSGSVNRFSDIILTRVTE